MKTEANVQNNHPPDHRPACSYVHTCTHTQLTAFVAEETWENDFKIKKEEGRTDSRKTVHLPTHAPRVVSGV